MRNDVSDKLGTGVAIGAGVVVVVIIAAVFGLYGAWAAAFVGVKLWAWFVVPVFAGAPLITLPQAFGLSLLCHFWTHQHFTAKCKDERSNGEKIAEGCALIASPWVVLFIAWICKAYFLGA